MLSLELIDSGLVLARKRGDGGANSSARRRASRVLEDRRTLTGAAAAQRVRLQAACSRTRTSGAR